VAVPFEVRWDGFWTIIPRQGFNCGVARGRVSRGSNHAPLETFGERSGPMLAVPRYRCPRHSRVNVRGTLRPVFGPRPRVNVTSPGGKPGNFEFRRAKPAQKTIGKPNCKGAENFFGLRLRAGGRSDRWHRAARLVRITCTEGTGLQLNVGFFP